MTGSAQKIIPFVLLTTIALTATAGVQSPTNAAAGVADELAPLRAHAGPMPSWGNDAGDTLEDRLNRVEWLLHRERCREALPMLLAIHDNVTSTELASVTMDGCTANFLLWAGLCHVCDALNYHWHMELGPLARLLARRAQTISANNARRLALVLVHMCSMYDETPGEFDEQRKTAVELYPAAVWQIDHVTRKLARRLDHCGNTLAALQEEERLLQRNPRTGSFIYSHAGILAASLGDYRRAFQHWYDALRIAPLTEYDGYGYYQALYGLRESLPYATLEELCFFPTVSRSVAARYPADVKDAFNISRWLALGNDTQVVLETTIRLMEESGNKAVTNLWQQALATHAHPEYARKLGQHDYEAQLYCEQLWRQKRLVRALTLARRIARLAPHMTAPTSNLFAQALHERGRRIGRYRREAAQNRDIAAMVAESDLLRRSWARADTRQAAQSVRPAVPPNQTQSSAD